MQSDSKLKVVPALAEKLGGYEIVASLGQGGMAEVFLAVRRGPYASNKLLVIKKLKSDAGGDQQVVDMFVDEARIAMRLSHPNVVSTFDFVAQANEFYLTMEFLDGQSLLQMIRALGRDKMPLELQVWILTQVLAGLGYAHELRDFDGTPMEIVHRDVTPSNVILTYSGGVKLVDFGIAKVVGAVAVTQSGTMKGKLGYVSPEQCLGKPTTPRSDLFSVGVMLWEAMARKRRTVGETPAAVYQARITGSELAIEDVWPQAPPDLAKIVRRALATAPENRYETAHEFQRDLERYLRGTAPGGFGTRALADFMTRHFAEAKDALHRTIESRVAGTSRGLTTSGPLASDRPPTPDRASWKGSAPGFASGLRPAPPVMAMGRGSGPPPRRKVVLALAIVAVAGVVTALAIKGGPPSPADLPRTATGQPNTLSAGIAPPLSPHPPAVVPLGVTPMPPSPDAHGRAEVRTAVNPRAAKAQVTLDGEPLTGAPVDRRPKRKGPTRPGAPAEVDASAGAPPLPVRADDPMPLAKSKATPVKIDPTDLEEGPGMDLHRRRTPAAAVRHIDEKDPYTP